MINTQNNEPKIRVNGLSAVAVDPINSFEDALAISRRFARLVDADMPGVGLKLTTATGDLAASISNDCGREDFAEEVAEVLLCLMIAASMRGLSAADIKSAFVKSIGAKSSEAVAACVRNTLAARGIQ